MQDQWTGSHFPVNKVGTSVVIPERTRILQLWLRDDGNGF